MATTMTLSGLPAGLTVRQVRYDGDTVAPADLEAALTVAHRIDQRSLGAADVTAAELVGMIAGTNVVRPQSLLVMDGDQPVGAGWYEVDEAGKEVFAESFVDPGHEDAMAVLDRMVRHGIDVGRAAVAGRPGWRIRAGILTQESDHAQVLRSHDYALIRKFWRMEIASDSPDIPTAAPALLEGVTFQTDGSEEHKRAIHDVEQAAFADHWDFSPRSYEETWRHFLSKPGARPEYWGLLRVDGDPAAVCILSDDRLERDFGYLSVLCVRREYRHRGLAQLMLRRTFVQFRDSGRAGTALHVDSQNLTGATRLYESVGMRPAQTIDLYELSGT